MLTDTVIVAVAELPARSVPVTVIGFDAELRMTVQENEELVTAAGAPLHNTPPTPDKASVTEPDTTTYGALTVAPFAGLVILTAGGVRSKLTVTLVDAVFAAVSTALPEITWLAPWVLTVAGEEQLEIGAPPGIQVKDTVTAELFQPLELGDGDGVAVIPGFGFSANLATNALYAPPSDV